MPDALCHLSNADLSLSVAPLGAEMQSLQTADGRDWLWNGDPAFWSGRAPILFPIVGRAPEDRVAVGTHIAEMKQHGLARRRVFEIAAATETTCRHVLRADDASRAVYPAEFELTVSHRLDGLTVHVEAELRNRGRDPFPFCLGFHPAFQWPLPGAETAPHHIRLADKSAPARAVLQDGLLQKDLRPSPFSNGTLTIAEDLFTEDALVFPNGATALRYGPDTGPALAFTFENLPDLALWKPQNAPFLCVEPWHGTASYAGDGPDIADRPNAILLQPGALERFAYRVTVCP